MWNCTNLWKWISYDKSSVWVHVHVHYLQRSNSGTLNLSLTCLGVQWKGKLDHLHQGLSDLLHLSMTLHVEYIQNSSHDEIMKRKRELISSSSSLTTWSKSLYFDIFPTSHCSSSTFDSIFHFFFLFELSINFFQLIFILTFRETSLDRLIGPITNYDAPISCLLR